MLDTFSCCLHRDNRKKTVTETGQLTSLWQCQKSFACTKKSQCSMDNPKTVSNVILLIKMYWFDNWQHFSFQHLICSHTRQQLVWSNTISVEHKWTMNIQQMKKNAKSRQKFLLGCLDMWSAVCFLDNLSGRDDMMDEEYTLLLNILVHKTNEPMKKWCYEHRSKPFFYG